MTRPDEQPDIPSFFSNLHFLIVDDEEFNLYLMRNILKKWGISFSEAHNGKEAIELASEKHFDLILMDLRMPLMDGYEATTEILRVHPNTKIIALTGTINPDNLLTGNESGILFYLQKPFTESALFDAVINLFPDDSVEKNQIGFKENAPVDLEELKRMTCGDRDFFNEMLKIFIRSSENGLAAIRHNFEISDWNAIGEATHKLAAPAKHLNASILYTKLKSLENEIEGRKSIAEIKKIIDNIELEIRHINFFLNKTLSEE